MKTVVKGEKAVSNMLSTVCIYLAENAIKHTLEVTTTNGKVEGRIRTKSKYGSSIVTVEYKTGILKVEFEKLECRGEQTIDLLLTPLTKESMSENLVSVGTLLLLYHDNGNTTKEPIENLHRIALIPVLEGRVDNVLYGIIQDKVLSLEYQHKDKQYRYTLENTIDGALATNIVSGEVFLIDSTETALAVLIE